jgi:hypothetical protein
MVSRYFCENLNHVGLFGSDDVVPVQDSPPEAHQGGPLGFTNWQADMRGLHVSADIEAWAASIFAKEFSEHL